MKMNDYNNLYFGEGQDIEITQFKPEYNMIFNNDDGEVATLDWNDGVLKFSGKMEKSAEIFLTFFKPYLDDYVKFKLQEEKMKRKILTEADLIRLSDLQQRRDKIDAEIAEIYGGVQICGN